MKKLLTILSLASVMALCMQVDALASDSLRVAAPGIVGITPDADNAGLKLPEGFGALRFTDSIGAARHIVATPQGGVYVKRNVNRNMLSKGRKGIVYFRDTNGDGRADDSTTFGDYGGTGITIKNGYLYASSDIEVFRYKLNDKFEVINPDQPEKIVTGLIRGEHSSKSIVLDDNGNLYVNIGANSNSCQEVNRTLHSPGRPAPCPFLDSTAGIWQFKADKLNQTYGDAVHYATGIRNVMGLDWNKKTNSLFVMQHGRDQLHDIAPEIYTTQQNAELPAEVMFEVKKGTNGGWPYIYYDPFQKKNIVAPEYGGDGKKSVEGKYDMPLIAFPAHMAPNALLFYTGNMFPAKYKDGAFVAFHGSWNRAPEPQEGYYVVFVPFKDGKPASDKWEVFADGFSPNLEKKGGRTAHRPCGLAQGPDGSLYVTDDAKGTVYRIVYNGK